MRILAVFIAIFGIVHAICWSGDFVVAPNGSDSNPGSAAAPFLTIQKAAQVMKPGDTCHIRAGTYRETVIPARSGQPGAPIVFRAYPNEEPVISGADPIGGWASHKDKIYKAPMPWTRNTAERKAGMDQVFVDGEMVPEARWPNIQVSPAAISRQDLARAEAGAILKPGAKGGDLAASRYTTKALKDFAPDFWKGGFIFFVPGALWCGVTGDVTGSTSDSVSFTYPWLSPGDFYETREKDFFFLWGKLEALDSPGEWFRDANGVLHLWPPKGNDPRGHLVEAKKRDLCFDLRGRSHIVLDGLKLFAGGIETDEQSTHILLDGIEARYVGHALWYSGWWSLATDTCIKLRGADSEIRNSFVAGAAGHGIDLQGARGKAVNNIVLDAGYVTNGNNINVRAEDARVEQNTLRGTGNQTCLELSHSPRAKALYNDISHSGRLILDEAAVWVARDTDGQNAEIAYNLIHDTHAHDDGKQYYGNGGIYLEGRVRNFVVHHNVMWRIAGQAICLPAVEGEQSGLQIYNNSTDAPFNVLKPQGIVLKNNVFASFQFDKVPGGDLSSNATWKKRQGSVPFVKDPGFMDAEAFDFRLRPGSPLIDQGTPIPPYTDGFAGAAPDIGAYEAGRPPFVAGAVLATRHLASLRLEYQGHPTASTVFTLAGLPPERKLPADFKLKIGAHEPGGTVGFEKGKWQVRGVPFKGEPGPQTVSAQIGDGKPVALKRVEGDAGAAANGASARPRPAARLRDPALRAKWEQRLRARVREEIAAGRPPRFKLVSFGETARILALDPQGAMKLRLDQGGHLDHRWPTLRTADLAELAASLATDADPASCALAAFFVLLDGQAARGEQYLSKAGPGQEAVAGAFEQEGEAAQP